MKSKNIQRLAIFNFFLGFNFLAPLAILYFSKVSGSYALGASVFGVIMLTAALFEVPTGIISDKVGRRQTIILGSWARVIAFGFYALSHSYGLLAVGAIFEGLSRAFYSGNNNAFLYDTLADNRHETEYHEYLGKTNSTEQLAYAIAAVFGGLIASKSYLALAWLAVLPQIIMLIVSYTFVDTKHHSGGSSNIFAHLQTAVKLFVHNKKLRLLSLASIINFSTSELSFQFRAAFFATVWPVWAIGFSNILSNLGASVSFYFSGKLVRRFKEVSILLFQSIYGKIVAFLGLLFPSWFSPILMSSSSLLFGVSEVAENNLMQQEFTDSQRATMSSLNSLAGSLGFAAMSLFLGGLADKIGPAKAMVVITALAISATGFYWWLFKGKPTTSSLASKAAISN